MKAFHTRLFLILSLVLPSGFCAWADPGIPDHAMSVAEMATCLDLTLYCLPDGSGADFTQARDVSGDVYDATVSFLLLDSLWNPIADYPAEDIWLGNTTGGLVTCSGGSIAERNTDSHGRTEWTQPLRAGGFSQDWSDFCYVYLNGEAVTAGGRMGLYFNSADITGDLRVDILDIVAFQFQTTNGYHRSIDLDYDGVLDILDVTRLTAAWLNECN